MESVVFFRSGRTNLTTLRPAITRSIKTVAAITRLIKSTALILYSFNSLYLKRKNRIQFP